MDVEGASSRVDRVDRVDRAAIRKAGLLMARGRGGCPTQSPRRIGRIRGPWWGSAGRPGILISTTAGVRNKERLLETATTESERSCILPGPPAQACVVGNAELNCYFVLKSVIAVPSALMLIRSVRYLCEQDFPCRTRRRGCRSRRQPYAGGFGSCFPFRVPLPGRVTGN